MKRRGKRENPYHCRRQKGGITHSTFDYSFTAQKLPYRKKDTKNERERNIKKERKKAIIRKER